MSRLFVVLIAAFSLLTGACAASAEPSPAPASRPASGSQPSAAPGAVSPSPGAQAEVAGSIRFEIVSAESEARYRVREQLANLNLPNDAIGRTKSITGNIVLAQDGSLLGERSVITIDVATLRSDSSLRDNYVRSSILQTSRYPKVEFAPTEIKGLSVPIPASGQRTFQLVGNLTVRGVTKPATWDVTATFTEQTVTGAAVMTTNWEEFGISRPRVARVLSVADTFALEFDFRLRRV